jgi:hypothetical protein
MPIDRYPIVLATLLLLACGAPSKPMTEDVDTGEDTPTPEAICSTVRQQAEKVWSPEIRAELDLQVEVYEDSLDASDAERGVAWMESLTDAWLRAGEGTCRDHLLARVISIEEFYARFDCLGRILEDQRAVIDLLQSAGEQASDRLKELVAELESCVPVTAGRPEIKENPF